MAHNNARLAASLACQCALLCVLAAPLTAQGPAWDRSPFHSPTPTPRDGLSPDSAAFMHWLRANATSLNQDQLQRARERMFTYISASAKELDGAFSSRSGLCSHFDAAARLGVAGSADVAAALEPQREVPPRTPIPDGLTLTFQAPFFWLRAADDSWAVCFPYYFMPVPAGRQVLRNGVTTEVAVLSTLVAADSGAAGASQATILIAAAAPADSSRHVALWVEQLGVALSPSVALDSMGAWYASSGTDEMRRLLVIRRLPQRVVALAYVGVPGTFESNRPHFRDLLRTLAPRRLSNRGDR